MFKALVSFFACIYKFLPVKFVIHVDILLAELYD